MGRRLLVTGASGFLGRTVIHELTKTQLAGISALVTIPGRKAYDLRDGVTVRSLFQHHEPTEVLHLAYPGTKGIQTSLEAAADLVHDQLLIDLHVIDAASEIGAKLVCIGSVCEYPEAVTYPTGEDQLWAGYPEAVNAPYGVAKRAQQGLLEAYRRQYGLQSTQLIMGNMYGPGDRSGHVIPSLIRRASAAATSGEPLVVWGDGTASREFLYVEDAARAVLLAAEAPAQVDPINIVSGEEVTIRDLAEDVSRLCGYPGDIQWDPTKPNGQPRRHFSYRRAMQVLEWTPQMPFAVGLPRTIQWLREQEAL